MVNVQSKSYSGNVTERIKQQKLHHQLGASYNQYFTKL